MCFELKKLFSSRLMLISLLMCAALLGIFVFRTVKYNIDVGKSLSQRQEYIESISSGKKQCGDTLIYLSKRERA
ncbi:hypothetical protein [Ruminococcus sp. NK3A76]|uniref:hypothetical protein n=1 Tax=Ruminococcus sp. NK3A76 TaxID=877411 RepID=UPI0018DBF388|nr:hypothetical protein [Ruminococcus sp. NK3A76]